MKRFSFVISLWMIASAVVAQPAKLRYVEIGPSALQQTALDRGMSPLRYTGWAGGASVGYEKQAANKTHRVTAIGHYGSVSPSTQSSSAEAIRLGLDYQYLHRWQAGKDWRIQPLWSAGFSLLNDIRWHNGYSNNDVNFAFAMGPVAGMGGQYNFRLLKRNWQLTGTLHLPLVNITMRPDFAFGAPPGFLDTETTAFRQTLNSLDVSWWNDHIRLQTRYQLRYPLFNGNYIALQYQWEFYHFSHIPDNKLTAGQHIISFLTGFNH